MCRCAPTSMHDVLLQGTARLPGCNVKFPPLGSCCSEFSELIKIQIVKLPESSSKLKKIYIVIISKVKQKIIKHLFKGSSSLITAGNTFVGVCVFGLLISLPLDFSDLHFKIRTREFPGPFPPGTSWIRNYPN